MLKAITIFSVKLIPSVALRLMGDFKKRPPAPTHSAITFSQAKAVNPMRLNLLLAAFCLLSCRPQSYLNSAQTLSKEGNHQAAISSYQKHLEQRLQNPSRPASENPYFYYLLIGDEYLKLNDPHQAEAYYALALQNQVQKSLLSDRFRMLSRWLSEHGKYQEAQRVLKQHRELDPPMFNLELDAAYKRWLKGEDSFRAE